MSIGAWVLLVARVASKTTWIAMAPAGKVEGAEGGDYGMFAGAVNR